jgi:hypothetical protein
MLLGYERMMNNFLDLSLSKGTILIVVIVHIILHSFERSSVYQSTDASLSYFLANTYYCIILEIFWHSLVFMWCWDGIWCKIFIVG